LQSAVLADQVVVFVASLVIGAFGIHVGALVVTGQDAFGKALLTALVAAIVWSIASFFLGDVPYVGPLLTLLAYLAVVKWQYSASWLASGAIALLAWIVGLGVLSLLSLVGIGSLEAVGIPRLGGR
jgi:hypothetical protein